MHPSLSTFTRRLIKMTSRNCVSGILFSDSENIALANITYTLCWVGDIAGSILLTYHLAVFTSKWYYHPIYPKHISKIYATN